MEAQLANPNDAKQNHVSLNEVALLAAKGDNEAFSHLVSHFKPALFSMISLLTVPKAEEEDLMQEGLIGLYKATRLFDPALSSFATFARVCMRSALLDAVKKVQNRPLTGALEESEEEFSAPGSQGPERILMGKEELRELMEKVDRSLSPLERRIFGLSLQEKKIPEIASLLGKDTKSVENALYRLRKKLSRLD